ncbi:hypothetical protein NMG60_11030918 [Bertholletia excelsa]
MRARSVVLAVLAVAAVAASATAAEDLTKKCNKYVDKVTPCLDFASGKAQAPSASCCQSVGEITKSEPVCNCFVIQQVHNGSAEAKQLGIQEGRLLQIPSACKLNANLSDCPRLLNLPPNSPDAAIFKNASSATIAPSTSTGTSSPSTVASSSSGGDKHGPSYLAGIVTVAIAIAIAIAGFFSSFPFDVAP